VGLVPCASCRGNGDRRELVLESGMEEWMASDRDELMIEHVTVTVTVTVTVHVIDAESGVPGYR
jgi:hypothetical protein